MHFTYSYFEKLLNQQKDILLILKDVENFALGPQRQMKVKLFFQYECETEQLRASLLLIHSYAVPETPHSR